MKHQVIVVGAGPVGLTLAIDLGRRGIQVVLIEQKDEPAFLPKMERCNARTMEIYRRLGISEKIRAAGLPRDVPMDVFIVRSLADEPILRHAYPSVSEAYDQIADSKDGSMPLEPYQLISQYTLEPLLRSVAESMPNVEVRFGCELTAFTQHDDGVTAQVRAGGMGEAIDASYLVGCDGGSSTVRKQLGIKLRGEANIKELRQAHFYCEQLFDMMPIGNGPTHGRHYHSIDEMQSFLIMQDSTKHFTLHASAGSDEEMKALFEKVVGVPVEYEMLSCNPWRQNLLQAESYQEGRVFLAGDAVHLVIPTGGLGMNSGVGDAIDLAWKLAGTLQGWGGPALLASYDAERRQVGDRVIGASRYASLGRQKWRGLWNPTMNEETPEGAKARAEFARIADEEHRKCNEMTGAELGYRYVGSPIVCDIPGGPEHLFRTYQPTTWPGARLPHVWLEDGSAVQDLVPDGFALLRLCGNPEVVSGMVGAFAEYEVPLSVLDLQDQRARDVYEADFVLVRPDLHVVWRGDHIPDDTRDIASIATGHGRAH